MIRLLLLPVLLLAARSPPAAADPGHGGPVRVLALSADGRALASGGFDERLLVRRPPGASPRVARAHGGGVSALSAMPDGGWASGGEDGRLALWPSLPAPGPSGAVPARVLRDDGAPATALAAGPDALLATARDGGVTLWRRGTASVLGRHDGPATAAAFRADGVPVTGGADGTLRAWRAHGAEVLVALGAPVLALLALPDGALAAGTADGRLLLLGAEGTLRTLAEGARPVPALAASADGRLLLAASLGGSATLWSLPEGRLRATLGGDGAPVWAVALALDGSVAWTGDAGGRVLAWDAATGRALDAAEAGPDGAADAPREAATDAGRGDAPDPRGARVFRACAACHALRPGEGPRAGPSLHGVLGRRMGTLGGYDYSPRLARGDIVWTPGTVADLFTRGPAVVTPGTRMPDQRISDPDDMAALLRFLGEATR